MPTSFFRCLVLIVRLLLLASGVTAYADARVQLCETDVQEHPDRRLNNLAQAIAIGGHIGFDCDNAQIRITRTHLVAHGTWLDGEGKRIKLIAPYPVHSMFEPRTSGAEFRLSGLRLEPHSFLVHNTTFRLTIDTCEIRKGIIVQQAGSLTIRKSKIHDNNYAIAQRGAESIDIADSTFEDSGRSVLMANTIRVSHSVVQRTQGFILEGIKCKIENGSIFRENGDRIALAHRGGAIDLRCREAEISDTVFEDFNAHSGGAIFVHGGERTVIRNATFQRNSAIDGGGAIAVGGDRGLPALRIEHGYFKDNRAKFGGALYIELPAASARGSATFAGSIFAHNVASDSGGAIYGKNINVNVSRGAFVGNQANGRGAAVYLHDSALLTAVNTIASKNYARGGGSVFFGANAQFVNSTLAHNQGVAVTPEAPDWTTPANIAFSNSILAYNAEGSCTQDPDGSYYKDLGHNLQFPGTDCGATIRVANPSFGPLYAPMNWSPAFGGGDNSICDSPQVNRRDIFGQYRPRARSCSIGAVEGTVRQKSAQISAKRWELCLIRREFCFQW